MSNDRIKKATENMILLLADGMSLTSDYADDLHDEGYSDDEIELILASMERKLRSLVMVTGKGEL